MDHVEFFLRTPGCYLMSVEGGASLVLGYRCSRLDSSIIDTDGDDFFCQWLHGDWKQLLTLISPEYIIFERRGKIRSYKFNKLLNRITK